MFGASHLDTCSDFAEVDVNFTCPSTRCLCDSNHLYYIQFIIIGDENCCSTQYNFTILADLELTSTQILPDFLNGGHSAFVVVTHFSANVTNATQIYHVEEANKIGVMMYLIIYENQMSEP